ncbi:2-C-methyl-D-erythritol 4-phosphate cytidylyltransferase [Pedobacter yulinensis]|uniref:2-C-methyl-D-erythritol 4-phosphate cytidylyltransferase n=1 Tax=Pedobacter yulinensis TaxID=2126353 RepID=A0A2T3HLM3_9SPHI|nr:2-C-methyl-D-erythritol 4-phosphate cytidylyltransferase [Pedobacter yulinensis]PST83329.1 2-C-methyl-D-erythritol 4-phosphate cytidylyltransferase [Pedobacter yulinensis]
MRHYAIVVAGGSGNRMGADVPKQFLPLNGRPLLMYTLQAFASSSFQPDIILVLHPAEQARWASLCKTFDFRIPHQIVQSGIERFHSVKNALSLITEPGIVSVHDAARPLVSTELIDRCYTSAAREGNAVAAVQATDSIRIAAGGKNRATDRRQVFLVQTPQVFRSSQLLPAYGRPYNKGYTDDASVVESSGVEIFLEQGERTNIKITYPADLILAEALLVPKP